METKLETIAVIKNIKEYSSSKEIAAADRYYQMGWSEAEALCKFAREALVDALLLAFEYGRAKGYRMAKNQEKKRRARA